MKNISLYLTFAIFILFVSQSSVANPIDSKAAAKIAQYKIGSNGKSETYFLKNITEITRENISYFFLAELSPEGYIIICADDNLPPVLAYSFNNNADLQSRIMDLFIYDIKTRMNAVNYLPESMLSKRKAEWEQMLSGDFSKDTQLEQWPPEGTTTTGGWLNVSWNQGAPWNAMCPMDPVTSGRSYTGCPATAMAMILDFHNTTNGTQFSDDDDYHHNYAGRNYYIDDDYLENDFPSFPDLNKYLDTVNTRWQNHEHLTNNDMAALTFACGVAATQVFTSEGSGTFSVNQAFAAYQRLGCSDAVLFVETDEELFPALTENMQNAYPAHLAIVDEAWSTGHNVVVDGYNTDNYYHVNFGWGGTNNGWYLLPDEMPYSLTVIEGLVVDIMKDGGTEIVSENNFNTISIYPNPAREEFKINITDGSASNSYILKIYNNLGQLVLNQTTTNKEISVKTFNLGANGQYLIKLTNAQTGIFTSYKLLID